MKTANRTEQEKAETKQRFIEMLQDNLNNQKNRHRDFAQMYYIHRKSRSRSNKQQFSFYIINNDYPLSVSWHIANITNDTFEFTDNNAGGFKAVKAYSPNNVIDHIEKITGFHIRLDEM